MENHINYVYHANRELTVDEVFGLTALFNSALLDRYFRIISGNTQVNATEIRSIRFPAMKQVATIGKRLKTLGDRRPAKVEAIVLETLGINGRLGAYLMDFAFHLDEVCGPPIASGLRTRGVNVTTTAEAGLVGAGRSDRSRVGQQVDGHAGFKSSRPDFFQKRALRQERRWAFSLEFPAFL